MYISFNFTMGIINLNTIIRFHKMVKYGNQLKCQEFLRFHGRVCYHFKTKNSSLFSSVQQPTEQHIVLYYNASVGRFNRLITIINDYSCACVKEIFANTVCVRPLEKHLYLTTFDTDSMFYWDTLGNPTEMVSSLQKGRY